MKPFLGKFKIYPRGFLGAQLEPVLDRKRRSEVHSQGRIQYDVSMLDPNEDSKAIVANLDLENVYQTMSRNDLTARKFDFKEKAIQQFMWAFGTNNFAEWFAAQYASPSFGPRHQDFLEDTLLFIRTGKRRLAIQNWNLLLDEAERKTTPVLSEPIKSFFVGLKTLEEIAGAKHFDIPAVTQQWLEKDGGYADMLITGHILFGTNE